MEAACGGRDGLRAAAWDEVPVPEWPGHEEGYVWLRLWIRVLVLAFLVARPLPVVPAALPPGWPPHGARGRERLLAAMIDGAVTPRGPALRPSYDPRRLMSVITAVACRMLDHAAADQGRAGSAQHCGPWHARTGPASYPQACAPAPVRAGHVWVIPQLRWLHEVERVNPLGRERIAADDLAPPLDFALAGLPDWPGIRVFDRLDGLLRHPLSMAAEHNRRLATAALLGGGPDADSDAGSDGGLVAVGLPSGPRLREAAGLLGIGRSGADPCWLEVVLSWPYRVIGSTVA